MSACIYPCISMSRQQRTANTLKRPQRMSGVVSPVPLAQLYPVVTTGTTLEGVQGISIPAIMVERPQIHTMGGRCLVKPDKSRVNPVTAHTTSADCRFTTHHRFDQSELLLTRSDLTLDDLSHSYSSPSPSPSSTYSSSTYSSSSLGNMDIGRLARNKRLLESECQPAKDIWMICPNYITPHTCTYPSNKGTTVD